MRTSVCEGIGVFYSSKELTSLSWCRVLFLIGILKSVFFAYSLVGVVRFTYSLIRVINLVRVVNFAYSLVSVVSLVRVVGFAYSLAGVVSFAYYLVRVVNFVGLKKSLSIHKCRSVTNEKSTNDT